jgi:hypothetical protein
VSDADIFGIYAQIWTAAGLIAPQGSHTAICFAVAFACLGLKLFT